MSTTFLDILPPDLTANKADHKETSNASGYSRTVRSSESPVGEEHDERTSVEVIRIISACRAASKERRRYEEESRSYMLETLPPLTDKQRADLKALATRPHSDIDTSDIPEMTDEQWKKARRGHFYRPVKRQITARVDADILDWLKAQGRGYQSRINAILRRERLAALKSARARRVG